MRFALMGLTSAFAVLALGVPSSDAQSFFNKRYCAFGGGDQSSGIEDCSYNTWEQCRASASGLGRFCGENPNYAGPTHSAGPGTNPKRKSHAKRDQ